MLFTTKGTFKVTVPYQKVLTIYESGKPYTASVSIERDLLEVSCPLHGTKSAQLGGGFAKTPDLLARMLLKELIAASK